MSARRERRVAKSPEAKAPPYRAWIATEGVDHSHSTGIEVGFLITPADDPNRPLVFICADQDRGQQERGRAVTENLAKRIDLVDSTCYANDLRYYGRPDSLAPMPRWIYGLTLYPLDKLDVGHGVPCWPWCRFRIESPTPLPIEHPDIVPGAIVVVDGPVVAHVIHRDGDALILAPIFDGEMRTRSTDRFAHNIDPNDTDIIKPPLPIVDVRIGGGK